jgi:hypothetical protein
MKEDSDDKLIQAVRRSFVRLQIQPLETIQDNQYVKSTGFKRSIRATYCYVLHQDRTGLNSKANLVFRFRKNEKIENWFFYNEQSCLVKNWAARFVKMWSDDKPIPKKLQEQEMVTAQYGIFLTADDMNNDDFEHVLDKYLVVAIEAVSQASKRKHPDWSVYEQKIKSYNNSVGML